MVEIVQSLLICSTIMGVLTLGYRVFLNLYGNRYKAVWRYRIWFVIILGFLFFLRPRTALPEIPTGNRIPNGANIWGDYHHIPLPGNNAIVIDKEFIMTILFCIWILIAIGDLIYFLLEYAQFRKTIERVQKRNIPLYYKKVFYEEKRKLAITNPNIHLAIVSCVDSPMLIGYLEPTIVLPEIELSEDELHLVIRHELIHYKRKDTWWKFVALLVRCIHWFNPVVYRIADWMDTECESACDEAVLEQEDENVRILYGMILLKMIRRRATWKTRLATSFQDKKSTVQVRFMNIINKVNRKPFWLGAILVVAVVVGTGTYTTKANENHRNFYDNMVEGTTEMVEEPTVMFEEPTSAMVEESILVHETDENVRVTMEYDVSYEYETVFSNGDYGDEFLEGSSYVEESWIQNTSMAEVKGTKVTSNVQETFFEKSVTDMSLIEWLKYIWNGRVQETTGSRSEQENTSIPMEEWETMWE